MTFESPEQITPPVLIHTLAMARQSVISSTGREPKVVLLSPLFWAELRRNLDEANYEQHVLPSEHGKSEGTFFGMEVFTIEYFAVTHIECF